MANAFDAEFETFIAEHLVDFPNGDTFAHGLAYTGGIDITDKVQYKRKIIWVVTSSRFIGSGLRHCHLSDLANFLGIDHRAQIKEREDKWGTIIKTTKMIEPSSFGELGYMIVLKLREMYKN